jgi:trans-aconitate 2-methyltransferase
MPYLFRDTDIAATRLKVLAGVFAESTATFVGETVRREPRLVTDLGCGPGYVTHALADILPGSRVIGLENSQHFIALAQETATERVSFYRHDVTTVPFPVGPSDLLFCRFVLTHLRDPETVLARWGTQLRPQGFLLVEESEWIHTDLPLFALYLEIVVAMLEDAGNQLYVGSTIDSVRTSNVLVKRVSKIRRLPVPTPCAATMFYLNMQAWKDRRFVRENYSPIVLEQLESGLEGLTGGPDQETNIEWGLRQMAFERV